jgi:hypothetical protein
MMPCAERLHFAASRAGGLDELDGSLMTLSSAQQWDLTALTMLSLATCALFVVVRGIRTLTRPDVKAAQIKLRSQLGQMGWDFTQNFATSTGVIGSVLTLILTNGALPTPTRILPNGTYAGLAVFFGTLVIIAPILYNGTATRVNVAAPTERDTGCEYRGRVWGFLLAAVATEWGLLGSISTVFLILLELYDGGSLPALPVALLSAVLGIAVLAFARYSWLKIDGTIRDQFGLSATQVTQGTGAARAEFTTTAPKEPKPRLTLL